MQEITLRELCKKYDVSRRAVQGYEKAGLVQASGKNKMGHLLYDMKSQERIQKIRMFQNIGFSIKDIAAIIDLPREEVFPLLEEQVKKLEKEQVRIEEQIIIVHKLLQQN